MTSITRTSLENFLEQHYQNGLKDKTMLEVEYYSEFLDVNADILETIWEQFEEKHPELSKNSEKTRS